MKISDDGKPGLFKTASNPKHGIYVHIPFCQKKCAYCDFYSLTDLTLRQPFVDSLLQEMVLVNSLETWSDTLYFGGGTPSVLTQQQIETIMQQTRDLFTLTPDAEITMEVNPGTVTQDYLNFLKQTGINRINIGVQSFSYNILEFLGRIHSPGQATRVIQQARKAGFDNVGLDLIFGIPGQDASTWQDDLKTALTFAPEHLSCYILSFENGTPLDLMRKTKAFKPAPEHHIADLFRITQLILNAAGYEQYEISNYARIGDSEKTWRSRHNQKYWSFAPYTGLGPGAHSYSAPLRYWNVRDVGLYSDALAKGRLPVQEREKTTTEQQMTEAIYLGLRTCDGIDIAHFEKSFQINFNQHYGDTLKTLYEENLVIVDNGRCVLTSEGMLFHNSIVERLIN